ncbi:Drug/metabolite transporter [Metarhizium rileyi]|uniref:Drug/metabolite transporter n=1 Tax=Metarhizium rileyi (strain RCEF 4871) TaxID=1649241 RepID=A0A166XD55_METRR|nr:Drug/metabolite transporter [Metarhizium rileyi RCEF 4871]TWU78746.1 hypothetical protein ED733_006608 [Metarhizium rileyi]
MDRRLPMSPPLEDAEGRTGWVAATSDAEDTASQNGFGFRNTLLPNASRSDKSRAVAADAIRSLSPSPAFSDRPSSIIYGPYRPPSSISLGAEARPSALRRFWLANKPSILVALSQFFGATMNLSARFLELEGEGMHPVQMLLLRQSVTSVCCLAYMWRTKTPDFPFGKREVRWLLLVRGCTGFFGIFGMWWSMMYLPLADATVITFLAPGVAGFVCYYLLREPFTRLEQLATLVAFVGVVLIAQPAALFAPTDTENMTKIRRGSIPSADHEPTPRERLLAVAVALLGVFGAAGAFTSLRAIGKRVHPLISVNGFAMICTVICVTALWLGPALDVGQPSLRWVAPTSLKQWLLLLSLGALGFVMQYLLTTGLAADKSNRANAMIYTHMLFAASFDRWIFGRRMGIMSFAGCALILSSAIGVIFMKRGSPVPKAEHIEGQSNLSGEAEGSPMLVGVAGHAESVNLERNR